MRAPGGLALVCILASARWPESCVLPFSHAWLCGQERSYVSLDARLRHVRDLRDPLHVQVGGVLGVGVTVRNLVGRTVEVFWLQPGREPRVRVAQTVKPVENQRSIVVSTPIWTL